MGKCKKFNKEIISCFVDGELPPGQQKEVEAHAAFCMECHETIEKYRKIAWEFEKGVHRQTPFSGVWVSSNAISGKNRETIGNFLNPIVFLKPKFLSFVEFLKIEKISLQVGSFAAILVLGLCLLPFYRHPFFNGEDAPVLNTDGPSAIIQTVSGDLSSVMILETEENQHTIIWYKET